jgi:hypothetical protein
MVVKRRSLKRSMGVRRYKKLFIIATEGAKTEPLYFPSSMIKIQS